MTAATFSRLPPKFGKDADRPEAAIIPPARAVLCRKDSRRPIVAAMFMVNSTFASTRGCRQRRKRPAKWFEDKATLGTQTRVASRSRRSTLVWPGPRPPDHEPPAAYGK